MGVVGTGRGPVYHTCIPLSSVTQLNTPKQGNRFCCSKLYSERGPYLPPLARLPLSSLPSPFLNPLYNPSATQP